MRQRAFPFICLAALLAAPACASTSYMGISMLPGEAAPEVQALAGRAREGDKQAQFDLGVRFEDGRGVPVNLRKAVKLYRYAASNTGGNRTIFVPDGGGVAATTVNSGDLIPGLPAAWARAQQAVALKSFGYPDKLWPKSFDEARRQSLSKLSAIIAICEQRGEIGTLCQSAEYKALHEATKFETRFRACRIKFRWRGAAEDPYKFSVGSAADTKTTTDVRRCMLESGPVQTNKLNRDSVQSIWLASYITAKFIENSEFSENSPEGRDFYYGVIENSYGELKNSLDSIAKGPDSIMGHAVFEMTKRLDVPYIGPIGGKWWWNICRSYKNYLSVFEKYTCVAIDRGYSARVRYDYERYGHY